MSDYLSRGTPVGGLRTAVQQGFLGLEATPWAKPPAAWFAANWQDVDCEWRSEKDVIRLRGTIQSTAAVTGTTVTAFTVPYGVAPQGATAKFVVSAPAGPVEVAVAATGAVSVNCGTGWANLAINDTVALDICWAL